MKFIDNKHKKFFFDKWEQAKEQGKTDIYYKSLIYTLSICEIENEQISSHYAPSEIFCCSYAPYFWEGIKMRYPEYTNYEKNNKTPRAAIYMRVGNIEQLDYHIEEKINNKVENRIVGLYIRVGCDNDAGMRYSIDQQRKMLDDFCKKNNIGNRIEYIDIGKSALEKDRKALQKMIEDIKNKKINTIIVKDMARLFRNPIEANEFFEEDFMEDIEIISLDNSIEDFRDIESKFENIIRESIHKVEEETEEEIE